MNSSLSADFGRSLKLEFSGNRALVLFGPRKTGKTTLIRKTFPKARFLDLLKTDVRLAHELNPALLRGTVLAEKPKVMVVDEVQKVPSLVDEVHWCLENTDTAFVLCGSSARSLKRELGGLLGGRAWRFDLFPLTTHELGEFDLQKILVHGLIPSHYRSRNVNRDLRGYITDYIEEEIRKESKVRNVPAFSRFLETAGKTATALLNYSNAGRECGVSPKTVREYYQILEDTLLGFRLPPWEYRKDRRLIETEKFYFFDCGVLRYLRKISYVEPETDVFGALFESFLMQEIRAYQGYSEKLQTMTFWRTSTDFEVDLIIGEMEAAIEFKSAGLIHDKHLKGLRALAQEHEPARRFLVCREVQARRTTDGIDILPWQEFCRMLWKGGVY